VGAGSLFIRQRTENAHTTVKMTGRDQIKGRFSEDPKLSATLSKEHHAPPHHDKQEGIDKKKKKR
jgi:hypothetical protein